jgi:hypothetical protein
MAALKTWNGGVIIISHDERFITTVAKEVRSWKWFEDKYTNLAPAVGMCGRDCVEVQGGRTGLQGQYGDTLSLFTDAFLNRV